MAELKECPKCKQNKGEFIYSESATNPLPGSNYTQRGSLYWYECKNCGEKWSEFKPSPGPAWRLPIED